MGLALGVCEKKKRWCLLASQTGVILLATPLLFLSSYLISVLPLIGWDGREKKIRRQRLCRFFFPTPFLQAASPQEILEAFHGAIPFISSTYLS